jgi:hypothetical protein
MGFVRIKLGSPFFVKLFNFLIILVLVFSSLVATSLIERIHLLILKITEADYGQIDLILTTGKGNFINTSALQARLTDQACARTEVSGRVWSDLKPVVAGTSVRFLQLAKETRSQVGYLESPDLATNQAYVGTNYGYE